MADMTLHEAQTHVRRRARAVRQIEPPKPAIDWNKYLVLLAVAVQSATMIWWAAGQTARTSHLEAVVKPLEAGDLRAVTESTKQIADDLRELRTWVIGPASLTRP